MGSSNTNDNELNITKNNAVEKSPKINNTKPQDKHKRNLILFSIYKMLSYDLLFFYIVQFLFYTDIKHLSAAQILFFEAFYPFFKLIIEPLIVGFIDSHSKKAVLFWANFALVISIVLIILPGVYINLILSNFFMALGFAIKDQVESTLAYKFIEEKSIHNKMKMFLKIEGNATSKYHLLNSVTSLLASLLYIVNPYLPFIFSITTLTISCIICLMFKIHEKVKKTSVLKDMENYIVELKDSFKFINKSKRISYLIIFNAVFHGIISFMVAYRSSLLTDINVNTTTRGILFATFSLVAYVSCKKTSKIQSRLKNKTLTTFTLIYLLLIILSGFIVYLNFKSAFALFVLFIILSSQYFIEGPYLSIINQYLSNFTNSKIESKIFSVTGFVAQLISLVYMLLASLLLDYFSTAIAFVFIGGFTYMLLLAILIQMKNVVGLKPDQYPKEELFIDLEKQALEYEEVS